MSAFLVQDETIDRILSYLNAADPRIARELYPAPEISDTERLDLLGGVLFSLNCDAIDARYGASDHFSWRSPWQPYRFTLRASGSPIDAYKALRCWLYQCAEGTIPETPLYRAMSELGFRWAHDIIARLPEYDRARWDG